MLADELYEQSLKAIRPITDAVYKDILTDIRQRAVRGEVSFRIDLNDHFSEKAEYDVIVHRLWAEGFKAEIRQEPKLKAYKEYVFVEKTLFLYVSWDKSKEEGNGEEGVRTDASI